MVFTAASSGSSRLTVVATTCRQVECIGAFRSHEAEHSPSAQTKSNMASDHLSFVKPRQILRNGPAVDSVQ